MKMLTSLALTVSLTIIAFAQTQEAHNGPKRSNERIEQSYDRFGDTTSLVLTYWINSLSGVVDLGNGSYYVRPGASQSDIVKLHVMAATSGKVMKRDAVVLIALSSRSRSWIYLKQINTLRMIVNGTERLDFGEMKRVNHGVLSNGGVTEQLAVSVSLTLVEKLARATKIEVQIGGDEFELTPVQIADLKDFVDFFPTERAKT